MAVALGALYRGDRMPAGSRGEVGRIVAVSDGFHPPVEEYLEAVFSLAEEGTPVIQARLAERLQRSAPSVSEMLDRLEADGYIRRDGRRVELTEAGMKTAEQVVRRHRLAERLLVDVIGLEWHKAHAEAGRWEHVISDDVEERLVELLGNPATCPHGNPIPGAAWQRTEGERRLSDALSGERLRLVRITEEVELDAPSLRYLADNGFLPGSEVVVKAKAPDGTLTLLKDGESFAIGPGTSRCLFVTGTGTSGKARALASSARASHGG